MNSLHNAPHNHLVTPDSSYARRHSHKFFQSTLSSNRTGAFASANRHSYVSERIQQWHWDSSTLSWRLVRSIKAKTFVRLLQPSSPPRDPAKLQLPIRHYRIYSKSKGASAIWRNDPSMGAKLGGN